MKIGIMQPYLFPYLGYFQLIHAVDVYVMYDDAQFIKGGWINRNNYLIGGQKVLISIPLPGASPNKQINQIEMQGDFSKFLKTIAMAYSRAPYSGPVMDLLHKIFRYEDKNLARFVSNSLMEVADYAGIDTKFVLSSTLPKDTQLDAQGKVVAMCMALGGDTYVNAIGGQSLYDEEVFKRHGLGLRFLQSRPGEYRQFGKAFVPGLAIIDVMMFNSPEEVRHMLNDYELV